MLIYKYIRDLYSLLDSLFFKSQVGIECKTAYNHYIGGLSNDC